MNKISQAEELPAAGTSRLLLPVDFQPNPDKDILMSTTTTTSSLSFAARSSNALLHRTIENCLSQYRRQFSVLESSSRKQHFEAVATTLVNLFVGDGFRFIVVVASSAETSTSTGTSYYQVPLQEAIRAVQNHLMTRSFTLQAQDSSSTPSQGVVQAQNNNTSHGSSADIIISTPKNFNSNAAASTSSSTTPALPIIPHATRIMKNHSSPQESTNNAPALLPSATTTTTPRAPVIHADQGSGGASAFDRWSPNTMHAATTLSMLSQNHQHQHQNHTEECSTLKENDPTSTFTTTPAGPRQLWWSNDSHRHHPNHPQGTTSTMAPATISPETVVGAVSNGMEVDTATDKSHKTLEFGRASADYQALVQAHVAAYAAYEKDNDGSRIKIDFCRALLQSLGYTSFVNISSNRNRSPLTFQQAARKLQKSLAHAVSKLTPTRTAYTQANAVDPSSSDIMEYGDEEEERIGETTFAASATTTKRQRAFQVGRYNPVYQAMVQAHALEYAGVAAGTKIEYCRFLLTRLAQEHGCTTSWFVQKNCNDDEMLTLEEAAVKLQKSFGHVLAKQNQEIIITQEASSSQKKTKLKRGNHYRRGAAGPMTLQQATTKKFQKSSSRRRIIMNDNDDDASRNSTHILQKKNKNQNQNQNKIVLFGRGVKSDLNPDYLELVKENGRGYQKADNKKAFMRDFAQSLLDDGWEFYKADQKQHAKVKVVDLDRLVSVKIKNDFRRRLT